jgi:hypothetical protein
MLVGLASLREVLEVPAASVNRLMEFSREMHVPSLKGNITAAFNKGIVVTSSYSGMARSKWLLKCCSIDSVNFWGKVDQRLRCTLPATATSEPSKPCSRTPASRGLATFS